MTPRPAPRGAALAVVLWALIALGALSLSAALAARLDLALGAAHRDHAAALAAAEAGLAEALARLAADPEAIAEADSLDGTLETGSFRAVWSPAGGRVRLVATGRRGAARREVEAWAEPAPGGGLRLAAWRESW